MKMFKIVVIASSGPSAILRDEYTTAEGYSSSMSIGGKTVLKLVEGSDDEGPVRAVQYAEAYKIVARPLEG
jgi:hypothetical protein